MQKVDGKDIAWLLRCKECSKTLKIKDVKETITGDFKMCDKHLEMIEKKYNKTWNVNYTLNNSAIENLYENNDLDFNEEVIIWDN